MAVERSWLLAGLCLLAGYAFGNFMAAEIVARCLAGTGVRAVGDGTPTIANLEKAMGKPAGLAVAIGDVLKTVLICWFCYRLAAPELEERAILYGGMGVLLGHVWPLWLHGKGGSAAPVVCTWVILYLPVTGALCCLAGGIVSIGTGHKALGLVLIPFLATPLAWMQFGVANGGLMLVVGLLLGAQQWTSLSPEKKQ